MTCKICGAPFEKMFTAALVITMGSSPPLPVCSSDCAIKFLGWRRGKQAFRRRKYCATMDRGEKRIERAIADKYEGTED